jgi:hypothetical protein
VICAAIDAECPAPRTVLAVDCPLGAQIIDSHCESASTPSAIHFDEFVVHGETVQQQVCPLYFVDLAPPGGRQVAEFATAAPVRRLKNRPSPLRQSLLIAGPSADRLYPLGALPAAERSDLIAADSNDDDSSEVTSRRALNRPA